MNDAERIILTLSDSELVLFHKIGGSVPLTMKPRLKRLLAAEVAEQHAPLPPVWKDTGYGTTPEWDRNAKRERRKRERAKRTRKAA